VGIAIVLASCSASGSEEAVTDTSSAQTEGSTVEVSSSTTYSDENEEWIRDAGEFTIELATGASIKIRASIGEPLVITDPEQQINGQCLINELPEDGTVYQRIRVEVESLEERPMKMPRVLFGVADDARPRKFTSLWQSIDRRYGVPFSPCEPKQFAGSFENFAATHTGSGSDDVLGGGGVEVIDLVTYLEPDAHPRWKWAILVTTVDEEAEASSRLAEDSLQKGSALVDLSVFRSSTLIEEEVVQGSEDVPASICQLLEDLEVPSIQLQSSPEDLETLQALFDKLPGGHVLKMTLAEVIDWYRRSPPEDRYPVSHTFALSICDQEGL
jgi:hypothetical protein